MQGDEGVLGETGGDWGATGGLLRVPGGGSEGLPASGVGVGVPCGGFEPAAAPGIVARGGPIAARITQQHIPGPAHAVGV